MERCTIELTAETRNHKGEDVFLCEGEESASQRRHATEPENYAAISKLSAKDEMKALSQGHTSVEEPAVFRSA